MPAIQPQTARAQAAGSNVIVSYWEFGSLRFCQAGVKFLHAKRLLACVRAPSCFGCNVLGSKASALRAARRANPAALVFPSTLVNPSTAAPPPPPGTSDLPCLEMCALGSGDATAGVLPTFPAPLRLRRLCCTLLLRPCSLAGAGLGSPLLWTLHSPPPASCAAVFPVMVCCRHPPPVHCALALAPNSSFSSFFEVLVAAIPLSPLNSHYDLGLRNVAHTH